VIRLLKHKLVQDSLILGGVQISAYILPMITLPYLTRVLGPANFGLIALGSALVLYFVVVIEYGFAVTGTRRVAVLQQDPPKVWRVYSNVMACKLLLVTICFFILIGVVMAVPKLRENWPLYLVSYSQALGLCLSPNWLLQGMQRMKLVAISDYGGKIISVALIFLLVRHGSDYLIAAALQSGSFLIAAIFGLAIASHQLRMHLVLPSIREMREYMLEGWPVFLSFASGNVMTSSNTMILGMTAAPEQVGFLNAASRLIIASRALANPVANAVYPHMSQLAARSRQDAVSFLKRRLLWTAAPFLLISLGMILFSPLAVRILYGARFKESAVLLRLMSPTPFVHALSMCFGTYFMLAFGYEKAWSRVVAMALVVNFVLIAVLMQFMLPARAVALTTSLTDIFVVSLCMRFFFRTVKDWRESGGQAPRASPGSTLS
jgi:PST family polysaccharide transporter